MLKLTLMGVLPEIKDWIGRGHAASSPPCTSVLLERVLGLHFPYSLFLHLWPLVRPGRNSNMGGAELLLPSVPNIWGHTVPLGKSSVAELASHTGSPDAR